MSARVQDQAPRFLPLTQFAERELTSPPAGERWMLA
jgi:hypothetical protein